MKAKVIEIMDDIEAIISRIVFAGKRFFRNIWRIIQWVPVLWEDEDWNGPYNILTILSYKLGRVKKVLDNEYTDPDERKKNVETISRVQELIKDINEDDFCKEEWIKHTEKWGQLKLDFLKPKEGEPAGEVKIYREKAADGDAYEQERIECLKVFEIEAERQDKAYHELFELIEKNISKWWD